LHDEVGQTLTALRIEISRALERPDAPGMRDDMRRARDLANRAVSTTRDLSSLLRPSILDDLGLEAALQWQLEQFSQRSGIAASFTGNGLESDLPDALKTCAYRVVQEALHNCEKHSGASRVNIRLNDAEDSLSIGVRDDGIGFDPAVVKSGYGILGMSERATRLGGTFTLDSAPGCGVSIEVLVPKLETPAAVRSHAPNHCTAG
jgi:signal transduction histidine kinase